LGPEPIVDFSPAENDLDSYERRAQQDDAEAIQACPYETVLDLNRRKMP
jgi:hypothetical protein